MVVQHICPFDLSSEFSQAGQTKTTACNLKVEFYPNDGGTIYIDFFRMGMWTGREYAALNTKWPCITTNLPHDLLPATLGVREVSSINMENLQRSQSVLFYDQGRYVIFAYLNVIQCPDRVRIGSI